MGSVCSILVRRSATTIATATDKTAIAYREIVDGSDHSMERSLDMPVSPTSSDDKRDIPRSATNQPRITEAVRRLPPVESARHSPPLVRCYSRPAPDPSNPNNSEAFAPASNSVLGFRYIGLRSNVENVPTTRGSPGLFVMEPAFARSG
jgi:hypothetical protein